MIKHLLVIIYIFATVKNHIYKLYKKMNVQSRGQLVDFVLKSTSKNEE